MNARSNPAETRRALYVLLAFAAARLVFMAALGLGRDEAYTLVVSRRLALSYFDHPPLHQWLAHAAALAFGETVYARAPFLAVFALAGFWLYELTRRLYDARAGLAALVALNVTPFFFASAGTWIVPDGPLLVALAAGALALARLTLEDPPKREIWPLWLAVGASFGLAGLSKYSAALTAFGALVFLALDPKSRRWFLHPALYVAMALAALIVAPVFLWNADHGWVSFRFQGGRGAPGQGLDPLGVAAMALGEALYLLPWTFVALLMAAGIGVVAVRRGDARALFLLCLASPPILVFTITPLWGGRGLPHWAMPGWFFLFPLLGNALAQRGYGRRAALAASAFLAALALAVVSQTQFGWIERLAGKPLPDPTLELLDWGPVGNASALSPRPAFVATTKWWEAGKIGVALGQEVPIFVFSDDPRGVAFLGRIEDFVGRDGVIIAERRRLTDITGPLGAYFERLGTPESLQLGRGGLKEQELALVPAYGLTRGFPAPYPLGRR